MIERFFTDNARVGSTYRAYAGRSKKIAFAMGFAILDSVAKLSLLAVVAARGVEFRSERVCGDGSNRAFGKLRAFKSLHTVRNVSFGEQRFVAGGGKEHFSCRRG
jgi:hypothetical protein